MPLQNSFTATQSLGKPSSIFFTDTSTGTDTAIVERRIYLQKSDGTYLTVVGNVNNYTVWPINLQTFQLDILAKDYALQISIVWWDGASSSTPFVFNSSFNSTFN